MVLDAAWSQHTPSIPLSLGGNSLDSLSAARLAFFSPKSEQKCAALQPSFMFPKQVSSSSNKMTSLLSVMQTLQLPDSQVQKHHSSSLIGRSGNILQNGQSFPFFKYTAPYLLGDIKSIVMWFFLSFTAIIPI